MLTKKDLKWVTKSFLIYSKLMRIPVTFGDAILGEGAGKMRSEKSSIWRRIGFKIIQTLITFHTFFSLFRTLEYMSGSSGLDMKGNLDWDLVPCAVIFSGGYVICDVIGYLTFDSGRELNTKVYNESLKLRGKTNQVHSVMLINFSEHFPNFDGNFKF